VEEATYPLIVFTQVIPKVAIAPLLIVYLGFGLEPKVFLAFLVCFFPIVINTTLGLKNVSPELLELLTSLRATKWQVLWKVRVHRAVPSFVEGAKIAITLAVIGAVVAEFVSGNRGLGYLTLRRLHAWTRPWDSRRCCICLSWVSLSSS
jgi:NitT/TauT family transport system permease protein